MADDIVRGREWREFGHVGGWRWKGTGMGMSMSMYRVREGALEAWRDGDRGRVWWRAGEEYELTPVHRLGRVCTVCMCALSSKQTL